MNAVSHAQEASEHLRQVCHALYQPITPMDAYIIALVLAQIERMADQACAQLASRLSTLDPADWRDDRNDRPASYALDSAEWAIRARRPDEAAQHLSHIGRA